MMVSFTGAHVVKDMIVPRSGQTDNGCLMVIAGSHQWSRQAHYLAEVITSDTQGGIQ